MNSLNRIRRRAVFFAVFVSSFFLFAQTKTARELYETGLQQQKTLDWYGASESFHQALQLNPSYGDAWFRQAQCAFQLDEFTLCLNYLDNAQKYLNDRADIRNLRGMTLISLGQLDMARSIFEAVIKAYPNDLDARFGLAELDLFDGRLDGAEQKYTAALRRQGTNRKALLSLALVSAALGKNDTARTYIEQALQTHSGDAEVQYLAAWLAARTGDLSEAERRARSAVAIDEDYDRGYELLAAVLYAEGRYQDAADLCDFRIGRNRDSFTAWYLKGAALHRLGKDADAVTVWNTGLSVNPQDEIMRSSLELLAAESIPMNDSRRAAWAAYHIKKAREYSDKYQSRQARYEYQQALKLDPLNAEARTAFAAMLRRDGFNEAYLAQLQFIASTKKTNTDKTETTNATDPEAVKLSDTIEAFDSLLSDNLAAKWNVSPFYLDKTRWKIGLYYTSAPVGELHADVPSVTANMAASLFTGVTETTVDVMASSVSGYGDAYARARAAACDYFVLFSADDTARDFNLDAVMYSTRTGNEIKRFSVFRTGNDRFALSLQSFRQTILDLLPVRGKILARNGSMILIDLGLSEGIKSGTVFAIIRKGTITTADSGAGLYYNPKSVLGTLTVTDIGEEISQGTVSDTGFFDRINIGDEVVVTQLPKEENTPSADSQQKPAGQNQPAATQPVSSDTAPAADAAGNPLHQTIPLTPAPGSERSSALIDMIRTIY